MALALSSDSLPIGSAFERPIEVPLTDGSHIEVRIGTASDAVAWSDAFQPILAMHKTGDAGWKWTEYEERARNEGRLFICAYRVGILEALMDFGTSDATLERSRRFDQAPMLYIEHLAVAPKNRPSPIGAGAVRGIGSRLVATVRDLSKKLGYDGLVGLHSHTDSEDFYRKLGFTELKRESYGDGTWLYFEIAGDE